MENRKQEMRNDKSQILTGFGFPVSGFLFPIFPSCSVTLGWAGGARGERTPPGGGCETVDPWRHRGGAPARGFHSLLAGHSLGPKSGGGLPPVRTPEASGGRVGSPPAAVPGTGADTMQFKRDSSRHPSNPSSRTSRLPRPLVAPLTDPQTLTCRPVGCQPPVIRQRSF
jgi:hypothetical protein